MTTEQSLRAALELARNMILANGLDIPKTMEVIDKALKIESKKIAVIADRYKDIVAWAIDNEIAASKVFSITDYRQVLGRVGDVVILDISNQLRDVTNKRIIAGRITDVSGQFKGADSGLQRCVGHGGYGFVSDCIECNRPKNRMVDMSLCDEHGGEGVSWDCKECRKIEIQLD